MITRKTTTALALLTGLLLFTSACGMVGSLLGGSSGGTVDELWSDVPPVPGATQADLEMPLAARLAIQAMLQGRMNFIAYTTDQTPNEVEALYTVETMQAQGWNVENTPGCVTDQSEGLGAICFFGKEDGAQEEGLAIVIAIDDDTNETNVFYARIDLTEEAEETEEAQ